jgi:WD40 repeat protein
MTSNCNHHECVITSGYQGRVLTNINVWSADSRWIVYDTRSDPAGDRFDGDRIEAVHVESKQVKTLYRARNQANCGVATFHPSRLRVAFILGPENPTPEWSYGPTRRQGVMVDFSKPDHAINIDARDIVEPFTPGALRGGTHVHVWSPDQKYLSFTYDDEVLLQSAMHNVDGDTNQRNVAIAMCETVVDVPNRHPRNHSGTAYSVVVTKTVNEPMPGTDEILKACEEGWIHKTPFSGGCKRPSEYSLVFQGTVVSESGERIVEAFRVDLPKEISPSDSRPLQGTIHGRPFPPVGTCQTRLTRTTNRKYPGIQGPRHWLRSNPDGSLVGLLMKDDCGIVQFWTVNPWTTSLQQITNNPFSVASTFSWHPSGNHVAFVMDSSVCLTDVRTGKTLRLTAPTPGSTAPRPEACVFSPDGRQIAFVRHLPTEKGSCNQICVVRIDPSLLK